MCVFLYQEEDHITGGPTLQEHDLLILLQFAPRLRGKPASYTNVYSVLSNCKYLNNFPVESDSVPYSCELQYNRMNIIEVNICK